MILYKFIILNIINIINCYDNEFDIINPQRPINIQWSYPHFTNYLGMMHLGVRGSQYGFFEQYMNDFFPERLNFKQYNILLYLNHSILHKNGFERYMAIMVAIRNRNLSQYPPENNLIMYLWLDNIIFREEMQKTLSNNDVMLSWQLFYLWFINAIYYYPPDRSSVPNLVTNHDIMSGTYILLICASLRRNGKDDPLCPDPCKNRPCASIPNVATELCYQKNLGLFQRDYYCKCKEGFRWNIYEKRCIQFDLCSLANICNKHGTSRCVYLPKKMESVCECKVGYMGGRCSVVRDPCIETSNSNEMSGNMYCNTGQGNLCIGTPGTDRFVCICTKSWTQDLNFLSVSNCLAFRDLCATSVCHAGDCISSRDGQTTLCICPPELTGSDCSSKRAIWGRWLPWSNCDPLCGPVRRSVRLRFCDGDDCVGERRQVKLCEPTYCGSHPMFEYSSPYRWKHTYFLMYTYIFLLLIINGFICYVSTLMVIFVGFPGLLHRISSMLAYNNRDTLHSNQK